jgi:N-acetylglutamate synthase
MRTGRPSGMLPAMALASRIDSMADAAFPPALRAELDGWILRADAEPARSHRRNRSVWGRDADHDGLGDRIARAEAWYAGLGLPARFQITPATRPDGLEHELERRGYVVDGPSGVWIGEVAPLARGGAGVAIAERPDDAWLALSGADPAVLERVRVPCAYARSDVAAARGALHGEWLGIYEVTTLADARRRGAATTIMAALATWGLARGARHAYLLVLDDNGAANALYARLGISRAYGYRYRVQAQRSSEARPPGERNRTAAIMTRVPAP